MSDSFDCFTFAFTTPLHKFTWLQLDPPNDFHEFPCQHHFHSMIYFLLHGSRLCFLLFFDSFWILAMMDSSASSHESQHRHRRRRERQYSRSRDRNQTDLPDYSADEANEGPLPAPAAPPPAPATEIDSGTPLTDPPPVSTDPAPASVTVTSPTPNTSGPRQISMPRPALALRPLHSQFRFLTLSDDVAPGTSSREKTLHCASHHSSCHMWFVPFALLLQIFPPFYPALWLKHLCSIPCLSLHR